MMQQLHPREQKSMEKKTKIILDLSLACWTNDLSGCLLGKASDFGEFLTCRPDVGHVVKQDRPAILA